MTSKFLAPQDVADELGVDVQTVRRWIHAGRLRAFKPGKEYRIREVDLEEFLQAREVRPKGRTPSPLEPSLFNGLEEERRVSIDYAACRETLDGFCAHWEPVLSGDRLLDRQGFDDFDAAAKGYSRLFQELIGAEKAELGPLFEDGAPVFYSERSVLWPAIDRFMVLAIQMDKLGKEQFEDREASRKAEELRATFALIQERASA